MKNKNFSTDILTALKETFVTVESAVESISRRADCEQLIKLSGTTAIVALRRGDKIYIAHVGDSRALYYTFSAQHCSSPNTTWQSLITGEEETERINIETTYDHTPNRPDEKARIESHGGIVKQRTEHLPFRVYKKDKQKPGLAMSRAIGDIDAQQCGVSYEPELKVIDINKTDCDCGSPQTHGYLVIASDGVWEVLSNEDISKEIKTNYANGEKMIAERISQRATTKWLSLDKAMTDDITVIVQRIK